MNVVDIDGDGLLDVLCSATIEEGTGSYIAYYNGNNNWEEHDEVTPAGDGIAVVRINGVWDIAASPDGETLLYINPLTYGQNPRTTGWQAYDIGPGDEGNSLEGGMLNGVPTLFASSNEEPWSPGFVMFNPTVRTTPRLGI